VTSGTALRRLGGGIIGGLRSPHALVAGLATLAILFAGLTSGELWQARRETLRRAAAFSVNVADTVARSATHTIYLYDQSIKAAIAALALPGLERLDPEIRRRIVFTTGAYVDYLGVLLVTDAAGRVVMESGSLDPRAPDVSDRDYFTVPAAAPDIGLYVSKPFLAKTDGAATIGISRAYRTPDGRFGGIVMGALELAYFRDLTAKLDFGTGSRVFVLRDGGGILATTPPLDGANGPALGGEVQLAALPGQGSGWFESPRGIDGAASLYAYTHLPAFPITVVVVTPLRTVFGGWRSRAIVIGGATCMLLAGMLALGHRLHGELLRRREAEQSARAVADEFRMLAESASDIIMRLGTDGTCRYVSPAARDVLGYEPHDLVGDQLETHAHPDDRTVLADALRHLGEGANQLNATYRCLRKTGEEVWMDIRMSLLTDPRTGAPREIIATARDVSWQQQYEQELTLLAGTDGLTGVPNRRMFDETFDAEWRRAVRTSGRLALIMIDVDFFKLYNDHYGHIGGDAVLRAVAECIGGTIKRGGDFLARYGGEEFAVLLPGTTTEGARYIAEQIGRALNARSLPHEKSPKGAVTVSAGVASVVVKPGMMPSLLVQAADLALYEAKRRGRDQVVAAEGDAAELAAD
jgi:diguanylate cyclase (GGDEF)-like protein/PAS domain S-box-containing protein